MTTFNEAGHVLHDKLKGKDPKTVLEFDAVVSAEDDSDERGSERLAAWIETMKMVEKAVKDAPDTKAGKRQAAQALSKMTRQMSVEKVHEHVSEIVRDTCTTPVRAAFALITADHDTWKDALEAANGISDDEAKDIRLSKAKLREMLKEFYHPGRATLEDADIMPEHHMFFREINLGSTKTGAR